MENIGVKVFSADGDSFLTSTENRKNKFAADLRRLNNNIYKFLIGGDFNSSHYSQGCTKGNCWVRYYMIKLQIRMFKN